MIIYDALTGEYTETEDIVLSADEIKAQNQKQLLEDASKYNLTYEDVLMILAQNINMTLPSGEEKPLTEVVGTEIELPFKLGYKWVLNGTTWVSVVDEDVIGTMDNPIIYYEGVQLIDNAFYKKDGIVQVYMNGLWEEM